MHSSLVDAFCVLQCALFRHKSPTAGKLRHSLSPDPLS